MTGQSAKLNDRFEFPNTLNLKDNMIDEVIRNEGKRQKVPKPQEEKKDVGTINNTRLKR